MVSIDMEQFINLVPEKYRTYALLALAVSPYITRGIHAIASGGGIKGVFSAIWLGTNTPKPAPEVEAPK
jgi:hypothetical protein